MADMTGRSIVCDEKCGCPSPCPGGVACRCYISTGVQSAGGDPVMDHKKCSCGEHCKCNPCNCVDTVSPAAACKCGPACTCGPCVS